MVSGTEGWAVELVGNILHYSGGTWTKLPINLVPTSPTTSFDFHSIYLLDAANGWSVGTADVILHWDGVNWGAVTSPTLNVLKSISFGPPLAAVNPNDGWAVGDAGEQGLTAHLSRQSFTGTGSCGLGECYWNIKRPELSLHGE